MFYTLLTPDILALAEGRAAQTVVHHPPQGFSDRFAPGVTTLLRFSTNIASRRPPFVSPLAV